MHTRRELFALEKRGKNTVSPLRQESPIRYPQKRRKWGFPQDGVLHHYSPTAAKFGGRSRAASSRPCNHSVSRQPKTRKGELLMNALGGSRYSSTELRTPRKAISGITTSYIFTLYHTLTMSSSILDMFSLAGSTAMITGGTRGIGAEMAIALAEAGADIVLIQVL